MSQNIREVPLQFEAVAADRMAEIASEFADRMQQRRTVRDFSPEPVPRTVIEDCLRAAASAPSGANRQPWHFVAIAEPQVKRAIREAAEREERDFYERRAPPEWLEALAPLGTDSDKPFLESAPWLIAIFYERYGLKADGKRFKTYYAPESVGIATGILISALHQSGLATLTHTPSPMKFLREILGRPVNESPFLLLVAGRPAAGARVPDITRKALSLVTTFRVAD